MQVSGWDLHCARLAHSLTRIQQACLALAKENMARVPQLDADAVASLIAPSVQAAASHLNNNCSLWKVAILLFPRGTYMMQLTGNSTLVMCDPIKLWARCAGEGASLLQSLSTAVHVSPMSAAVLPPVILGVSGPPRSMPDAKDSQWAVDRVPLEQQLPEGATEGLLCTPDGKALEAFVSNFFVVIGEGPCPWPLSLQISRGRLSTLECQLRTGRTSISPDSSGTGWHLRGHRNAKCDAGSSPMCTVFCRVLWNHSCNLLPHAVLVQAHCGTLEGRPLLAGL